MRLLNVRMWLNTELATAEGSGSVLLSMYSDLLVVGEELKYINLRQLRKFQKKYASLYSERDKLPIIKELY